MLKYEWCPGLAINDDGARLEIEDIRPQHIILDPIDQLPDPGQTCFSSAMKDKMNRWHHFKIKERKKGIMILVKPEMVKTVKLSNKNNKAKERHRILGMKEQKTVIIVKLMRRLYQTVILRIVIVAVVKKSLTIQMMRRKHKSRRQTGKEK